MRWTQTRSPILPDLSRLAQPRQLRLSKSKLCGHRTVFSFSVTASSAFAKLRPCPLHSFHLGPENKMPATNLVCAPYRLVISTCYGELTAPELKSATVDLRRHPEFHPGFRQLIDLSHVVKLNLDFRDLYQLKLSDDPFSNEGKRAVFAPNDVSFGMS